MLLATPASIFPPWMPSGARKERGCAAYHEDGLPSGCGGVLGRSASNECDAHALPARIVRFGPTAFAFGYAVLEHGSREQENTEPSF
ncbi:unnamed protein product [Heligmosomoides polygyrus]|uniref:Secreted protein n=1 Tax=Heligmosomoides polygyrus TaxID=6339 RepID=A0A183GDG7_HELPZ|nr:unnamed protein product [Heligmosomoides polygyrus]